MRMQALTLKAPWGYAIARLGKNLENRTWYPPDGTIGTRIAIHQGAGIDRSGVEWLSERFGDLEIEHGIIVCTAIVAGWIDNDGGRADTLAAREAAMLRRSKWFRGPVGWVLTSIRPPRARVPIKGRLSLWHVPPRVAARL
jgi:hypothetical protein